MPLFWQYLQVSPTLRCLLKEVPSALGKWAVPCSAGISGAGADSSPSVPDQFFLSHLHNLNVREKKISRRVWEGRSSPSWECRYHNHPRRRTRPPCYQLRDVDSTNGISPNTPLLSSQLCAHPLLCVLKPVHWVHAVHVLPFAGLSSRTPRTPSHRGSTISLTLLLPISLLTPGKLSF